MATRKKSEVKHRTAADTTAAVDALMAKLAHPMTAEIEEIRRIVLAVDPSVAEGVKWNAPSFRTTEYFATVHLRSKVGFALILHRGAKARELPAGGMKVDDPAKLMKWLDADRAMVEIANAEELERKRSALTALLRQWIGYV